MSKPRNSLITLSNIDEKKSDNFFFCFKNIVLCSHSKRERSESAKRRGAERIIVELKKLHRALSLDSAKIKENGQNGLGIIYDIIGEAIDAFKIRIPVINLVPSDSLAGKLETYNKRIDCCKMRWRAKHFL